MESQIRSLRCSSAVFFLVERQKINDLFLPEFSEGNFLRGIFYFCFRTNTTFYTAHQSCFFQKHVLIFLLFSQGVHTVLGSNDRERLLLLLQSKFWRELANECAKRLVCVDLHVCASGHVDLASFGLMAKLTGFVLKKKKKKKTTKKNRPFFVDLQKWFVFMINNSRRATSFFLVFLFLSHWFTCFRGDFPNYAHSFAKKKKKKKNPNQTKQSEMKTRNTQTQQTETNRNKPQKFTKSYPKKKISKILTSFFFLLFCRGSVNYIPNFHVEKHEERLFQDLLRTLTREQGSDAVLRVRYDLTAKKKKKNSAIFLLGGFCFLAFVICFRVWASKAKIDFLRFFVFFPADFNRKKNRQKKKAKKNQVSKRFYFEFASKKENKRSTKKAQKKTR